MEKKIEILVHATAPSCAKDDRRYRRQATAFLKFEKGKKARRVESYLGSGKPENLVTAFDRKTEKGKEVTAQKHSDGPDRTDQDPEVVFVDEDQLKITTPRLPSSSTISERQDGMFVEDSSSPCRGASKGRSLKTFETEDIISSSTISLGQPEPVVTPDSLSRKRKRHGVEGTPITFLHTRGGPSLRILSSDLENQLKTSSSKVSHVSETPLPPRSVALGTSPSLNILSLERPPLESRRPRTAPSVETTSHRLFSSRSGLRRSQSTTASVESPLSVVPDSQFPLSTAPGRISGIEGPSDHRSQETSSQEPPNKRIRIEIPSQPSNSARRGNSSSHPISISSDEPPQQSSERSVRDEGPQTGHLRSPFTASSPTLLPLSSPLDTLEKEPRLARSLDDPLNTFKTLPYSSTAPPPPPGLSVNLTDISGGLRAIERGIPLAEYFKPISQSRELTPLERGYWEITLPIARTPMATTDKLGGPWTPQEFVKFYLFMDELILKNLAGWDVWAKRDPVFYDVGGELWDAEGMRRETYRLFCRGGIVGHMWLALFIGANRRVKGMGAVWKDAEENVVVRMARGREE